MRRLTHPNFNGKWKGLIQIQLPKIGDDIWKCNVNPNDAKIVFYKIHSTMWKEIVTTWCSFNFNIPQNVNDIKKQILWYNSCIRVQHKPVFYRSWYDNGIVTIKDLLGEQGTYLDFLSFCRRYPNVKTNFLTYQGLLQAIPKEWERKCLQSSTVISPLKPNLYWINKINGPGSPSRMIYLKLIEKIVSSDCIARVKWMEEFQVDIDNDYWQLCFKQIYSCTISSNLRIFQYKFLHRVIFLNHRLYKMNIKDTSLCSFCNVSDETIEHFFFSCEVSKNFWLQVWDWLQEVTGTRIIFSKIEILIGFRDLEDNIWSLFCILAKKYLYYCWQNKAKPALVSYKVYVKEIENIEYRIAQKNNKLRFHHIKWKNIKL